VEVGFAAYISSRANLRKFMQFCANLRKWRPDSEFLYVKDLLLSFPLIYSHPPTFHAAPLIILECFRGTEERTWVSTG
jgi:hypothetical protein